MCIKIVKSKEEFSYDVEKPLEEQIKGSKQVIINYDPADDSIDKFLTEIERLCKNGISAKLNIRFNHNNNLNGVKVRNEMIKLSKDLDINEVIKLMTLGYAEADKKLEEIVNCCNEK